MHKIQLNINSFSGGTATIPIILESQPIDNTEVIDRVFVDKAVEDSINKIIDYEKTRYSPTLPNGSIPNKIIINLFDKTGVPITYNTLGFDFEDLLYKRLNFTESMLRIETYDSDNTLTNRLIDVMSLNCRLYSDDIVNNSATSIGVPKNPTNINTRFVLSNPKVDKLGFSDGFFIYDVKNLEINSNKTLYMKFEFLNSKNGKTIKFMTENTLLPINELLKKLYFKYVAYRTNDGYYYTIDNSIENANCLELNLYEIKSL